MRQPLDCHVRASSALLCLSLLLALVGAASCSPSVPTTPPPNLLGQWRSAGGTIILDFQKGGVLAITVDNPSVTYSQSAEWQPVDSAHIRIIPEAGVPGEILPPRPTLVAVSATAKELTLTAQGGDAVRYRRVP